MAYDPIILIPLFKDLLVTTPTAALTKLSLDLNVPRFTNLLPHAQAMFLITNTAGLPAVDVAEWNVAFYSGFDRNSELTGGPINIASVSFEQDGPLRSAEYTSTSNFLLESRLQLWWQNQSGVAVAKPIRVSAVLGLRMYGS